MDAQQTLAAIDIGTNSIHMVVVRLRPELPSFTIISREKATVRLGDRDPETGDLTLEAKHRALVALRRCCEVAKTLNAEKILAVATSAVRESPNGREFLQQVETELGLWVNLISGQEEARRIYLGVLSGMEFNQQPHVVIDIGGGSTELILGAGHEPMVLTSTKVGAVRLTREFIATDPISEEEFSYLQAYIRGMLERAVEEIHTQLYRVGETEMTVILPKLVGTSGTIETIATILSREKLGMIPMTLNGYSFSLKELSDLIERMRRLSYAERVETFPGMSDRRAEIILAGAMILHETMAMLEISYLTVCERALREGIIVDWMLTHGLIEDRLRYQSSVRQRSVMQAAHRYQVDLEHAQRVANFSLQLFDQLQGVLHQWEAEARELLWAAAILHNCGHHISHSAHHKHSYYIIRHADLLGYTETEIETIANLARYHRKSAPKKKHENYRNLISRHHRQMVDQLSPILRLAVALDRRQIGAINRVQCTYHAESQTLFLQLYTTQAGDDCSLELWSLDYNKTHFEAQYEVTLIPVLEKTGHLAFAPPTPSLSPTREGEEF